MLLTPKFKQEVIEALQAVRQNFDGSDSAFAKQWDINASVYSRLKNGETEGLLQSTQWLNLGRQLNVSINERKWNMARTAVFNTIEREVKFCQENAKGRICVDDCGIGKTFSAKYLSLTLKNCFYVDASQAKTRQLFIRLIAKTIGLDHTGKYAEVKALIKYYLQQLPNPVIIIDEAGDLDYTAFLELKELWNATENACGWYLMGADGLREKITKGIRNKKVGYRELFSRYSENYTTTVPRDHQDRLHWYEQLITDVLMVNVEDKSLIQGIVKKSITKDPSGSIGGLRRAESLLIIEQRKKK
jgi:hypothetical protein